MLSWQLLMSSKLHAYNAARVHDLIAARRIARRITRRIACPVPRTLGSCKHDSSKVGHDPVGQILDDSSRRAYPLGQGGTLNP
jgi:hypothetical protein